MRSWNKIKSIKNTLLLVSAIILFSGCFGPQYSPEDIAGSEPTGENDILITVSTGNLSASGARGTTIDTVYVEATSDDYPGTTETLNLTYDGTSGTWSGVMGNVGPGEWLFSAEARDDSEPPVALYSGNATTTVTSGSSNELSIDLFENVGNVKIYATWTLSGGVDTINVTASRATFTDMTTTFEMPPDSLERYIYSVNLTAGEWNILVEGISHGSVCFTGSSTADVTAADLVDIEVPLTQNRTTPVIFSVEEGTYYSSISLDLTTGTLGSTIYYTLDGSDPSDPGNGSRQTFGAGIPISADKTVKAVAHDAGKAEPYSEEIQKIYTFESVTGLSSQRNHGAIVKTDGTVWTWGRNNEGQLGSGNKTDNDIPTQVGEETDWLIVKASQEHTAAIKDNGTLWLWGHNQYGQLGRGNTNDSLVPVQEILGSTWSDVAVGEDFTLAINSNGTLYAWGSDSDERLGNGTDGSSSVPDQISTDTDWASIYCGHEFALAMKTGGSLYSWGSGLSGALGHGNTANVNAPTLIAGITGVNRVAAGFRHVLAITDNGDLYAWGENYCGNLGTGDTTDSHVPLLIDSDNDYIEVAAGGYNYQNFHSAVIRSDGTLWTAGDNDYGQLGIGTAGTGEGSLVFVRETTMATDWDTVAAGEWHTMAVKTGGSVWAWGRNNYGQLGDGLGFTADRDRPYRLGTDTWDYVSAGLEFSHGIKSDGTLWAWGNSGSGRLGDGLSSDLDIPTMISADSWMMVDAGYSHGVAIKADGTIHSWGDNNYGQIGDGTSPNDKLSPTPLFGSNTWTDIAAGDNFTIAIDGDGHLWGWGRNDYGQAGGGSESDEVHIPTQIGSDTWIDIAAGPSHALGLKHNSTLWAWGANGVHQLGTEDTTTRYEPVQIGSDNTWTKIAARRNASIGIKQDGSFWGWGYEMYLGIGYISFSTGTPRRIGLDDGWENVYTGSTSVFAINNGLLYAFGENHTSQLGFPSEESDIYVVTLVNANTDWLMLSAGLNDYYDYRSHTLALKEDNSLWVWGRNVDGSIGTFNYETIPVQILE